MAVDTGNQKVRYYLDPDYRFVIENYNWAKPFSNFFPGVGGKWGVPMWVFYVNRAQCISSLGIRDKDNAIVEFHSFNKALQLIDRYGFRTFIKTSKGFLYEPFRKNKDDKIRQTMAVSSEELEINELNPELGIETNVLYFPLINEPLGALVRRVKLKNIKTHSIKLEVLDGLPVILPYGMNQNLVKFIPRHIEGMMKVDQSIGVPIYRLKQTPEDVSQIGEIRGGNYYLSLLEGENELLAGHFVIDPYLIFGGSEGYDYPWQFETHSIAQLLAMKQIQENKTPCAFTALPVEIMAGEEVVLFSLVGHTPDEDKLKALLDSVRKSDIFSVKRRENRDSIKKIKNQAFMVSNSEHFDQYCQQTFLDNALRGGMPLAFDVKENKSVFYLYSRKHGDLERDYNYFTLEPTYLSQGDGHYRDVNQNRRSDTWFFPEVEEANIVTFLNLLQLDGYNPLIVSRVTYTVEDAQEFTTWLRDLANDEELYNQLLDLVSHQFSPGEFIMKLEGGIGRSIESYEKILGQLLLFCRQNDIGKIHEGFWIDHWTYNLDLIERFLEIYPERLKDIFVDHKVFSFYDNPDVVLPRSQKYVLVNGNVRQYDAVVRDQEKIKLIESRSEHPTTVRTNYGTGKIYKTNLLVKLLSIIANHLATLDPRGIGIMMEADKPGWCDPLNGLPGLFGSSICETLELERLCRFIRKSLNELELKDDEPIPVYEELFELIDSLSRAVEKRLNSKEKERPFIYWEESNCSKEHYREKTKLGVSGTEKAMTILQLKAFLDKGLQLLSEALGPQNKGKLTDKGGVYYTYFINQVADYEPILADPQKKTLMHSRAGYPLVKAKRVVSQPLPLFLEGPVHMIKVHPEQRKQIYRSVKNSHLRDQELKMYRVCELLDAAPFEIGRIRAYAPGWIENGSIYTHMEHKWLLELLRSGLYQEFYREIKTALVPFLDPSTYGRSILEGSSYIVSSTFPDEKLHGRGFQPRLSGMTSEMLHMWTLMVAGEKPFFIDEDGKLRLRFRPILPSWLFTRKERKCHYYDNNGEVASVEIPRNAFAFKFIGKALVVYHNQGRGNTFGKDAVQVVSYKINYGDGRKESVSGEVLDTSLALDVRQGHTDRIDVVLS